MWNQRSGTNKFETQTNKAEPLKFERPCIPILIYVYRRRCGVSFVSVDTGYTMACFSHPPSLCPSLSLSCSLSLSLAFSLCTCLLEPMPSHLDIEFRKAAAVQRVVSVVNMIPEPLLCTVCMEPFTPHRASVPRGSIKVRDADTGPTPNPLVT